MLKTVFLNNFHLKSFSDRNAKKCWCSSIRNCTWSTTPGQGTSHSCVCRKISACHRWRGRWWWWWCWRWSWLLLLFDLSLKITNHLFVVTIVFQMFWELGMTVMLVVYLFYVFVLHPISMLGKIKICSISINDVFFCMILFRLWTISIHLSFVSWIWRR